MSKNFFPFDFEYTLDLFILGVQSMREFYDRGYYVAEEDESKPTRLDMCDEILSAYVEYISCEDWRELEQKWNKFCDTIKEYLPYLWD